MTEFTEKLRRESAGIEILPLETLRSLPEAGDYDSGIYFLWLGDELRYIGKSENVRNRFAQQIQTNRFHGLRGSYRLRPIPCDRHTCLALHSDPIIENRGALEAMLKRVERAYIAHYEPPDNELYASPNT